MSWFWAIYVSIGLWILMPGLVLAWEEEESLLVKVLGTIIAILCWPMIFLVRD